MKLVRDNGSLDNDKEYIKKIDGRCDYHYDVGKADFSQGDEKELDHAKQAVQRKDFLCLRPIQPSSSQQDRRKSNSWYTATL